MKIRRHISAAWMAAIAAMGLMASCSQSEIEAPQTQRPGGNYYLTLTMSLPTEAQGTRSETNQEGTSSDGVQPALDNENKLDDAVVYFYELENNTVLLTLADIESKSAAATRADEVTYTITYPIDFAKIRTLMGKEVGMAVVGNTTHASFSHNLGDEVSMLDATFSLGGIETAPLGKLSGAAGNILPLMNAKDYTVDFSDIDENLEDDEILDALKGLSEGNDPIFTYTGNVFKFNGAISLERGVARIEYRDKEGRESLTTFEKDPHIFSVGSTDGLYLKLYSMKPYNVSKESYLFRQVVTGDDEKASGQPHSLLGDERGTAADNYNWIVSPDWTFATDKYTKTNDFFSQLTISGDGSAYLFGVAAGQGSGNTGDGTEDGDDADDGDGVDDNVDQNGDEPGEGPGEEPGTETPEEPATANDGTVLISNLFKTDDDLTTYHPWIYVSENTLPSTALMTGENLLKYATGVAFTFAVLDTDGEPLTKETLDKAPSCISVSEETGKAKYIIITDDQKDWIEVAPASDGKYYITYVAPLLHNVPENWKNGQPLKPMHYGVVRNNTYQMSINSISGLPLPQKPGEQYLAIDIRVLAWAKREIHVSF